MDDLFKVLPENEFKSLDKKTQEHILKMYKRHIEDQARRSKKIVYIYALLILLFLPILYIGFNAENVYQIINLLFIALFTLVPVYIGARMILNREGILKTGGGFGAKTIGTFQSGLRYNLKFNEWPNYPVSDGAAVFIGWLLLVLGLGVYIFFAIYYLREGISFLDFYWVSGF